MENTMESTREKTQKKSLNKSIKTCRTQSGNAENIASQQHSFQQQAILHIGYEIL